MSDFAANWPFAAMPQRANSHFLQFEFSLLPRFTYSRRKAPSFSYGDESRAARRQTSVQLRFN